MYLFRQFSCAWLAILALLGLAHDPGVDCRADDRPNILFVLTDDQRYDHVGCAGHGILKTPHIDQLAAEGVRFTNAFVTTSICAASRASYFTGLYERTHKYTFGTPPLARTMSDASYPVLLRNAGYRTGFVGKFGVAVMRGVQAQMFDLFKPINRNPYFKKQPDGSLRHTTQLTGDHAITFLRSQPEGQPFCLSLSFNASHAEDGDRQHHFPWPRAVDGLYDDVIIPNPPLADPQVFAAQPEFLQRSLNRQRWYWRWDTPEKYQKNVRGYYRMISGIDHAVGRVLQEIQNQGLSENTVVIFASDNGYYLGSRGLAGKWSHYDESLRVPLIIYDPRPSPTQRGRQCSAMTLNVDIPATMLDLAGVRPPSAYQGRSLRPLLEGKTPDDRRTDTFCEHLMHYPDGIPKWEGVRDKRWVYARYFEQRPVFEFLHDLERDPQQLKNLATDLKHREDLVRMRKRCDQLRDELGGPYSAKTFPLAKRPAAQPRRPMKLPDAKRPPNVVMIISDDQAWTDYGFMGHPVIQTPNLDRLAAQSARFTHGYVPTALCRPSLATLITGLYAHQHGITGNDPTPRRGGRFARNDPDYARRCAELIEKIDRLETLPKLLAKRGYVSYQSGKWWEGNHQRGGFTSGMTHGDASRGGRHGDEGLKIGREGLQPVFDFIQAADDKPFFVWYAPFLPHTPHNPPERLLAQYRNAGRPIEQARYYAMCQWFDESCGQLVDYLREHGHADRTLIVYVTDNGWIQRTPQTRVPAGWRPQFAPRSKQSPNEGGIRTPILLRWPGTIRSRQIETPVSSIDLAPTILAACGIEPPEAMSGISLFDLLGGNPPERPAIFGEAFSHDIADMADPSKSLLNLWCIDGRWKLILFEDGQLGRYRPIHAHRPRQPQLYDLLADPHETINRAATHAEVAQRLRQQIDQWWPPDRR